MPFFFRKSTNIGPFRLNFSKSGTGASVGVKGARVTTTARGTTYVTVGGGGFYYRETLSGRRRTKPPGSPASLPPQQSSADERIATADVSELVNSSSEKLVQRLNERAKMFNPAWIFYGIAVAAFLAGFTKLSVSEPVEPELPNVTLPFTPERQNNIRDEYSMLVARYGQPDSIFSAGNGSLEQVPTPAAYYKSAQVKVTFAPNGCVQAYETVMRIISGSSQYPALAAREFKNIKPCAPLKTGWTVVAYTNATLAARV
jgi:hypothetical protein